MPAIVAVASVSVERSTLIAEARWLGVAVRLQAGMLDHIERQCNAVPYARSSPHLAALMRQSRALGGSLDELLSACDALTLAGCGAVAADIWSKATQ